MKLKIILPIIMLAIPITIISWKYQSYKEALYEQPPFFDLFIAETFFKDQQIAPWNDVDSLERRPIDWKLDVDDFSRLDSVFVGFQNNSSEQFYYMTWGTPNSRMRIDYTIYKNGKPEAAPFGGFGCGTGIYLLPVESGAIIGGKILNPLMADYRSNYDFDLESDSFPDTFRKIYGDSVKLRFRQATYSNPWNEYESQYIYSDDVLIKTADVLKNWEKGNYIKLPKKGQTLEEFYGGKKMNAH